MPIRVTRLRRQSYSRTVEVLLDERIVARLAPGMSSSFRGNGRDQQLVIRSEGFVDSPPLLVRDPGRGWLQGVVVTYTTAYRLPLIRIRSLRAEVMGPPIHLPPGTDDLGDLQDVPEAELG